MNKIYPQSCWPIRGGCNEAAGEVCVVPDDFFYSPIPDDDENFNENYDENDYLAAPGCFKNANL